MNLSYKAIKFIVEAIEYRIDAYQVYLDSRDDLDEDTIADIGNDCGFLEALRDELMASLKKDLAINKSSNSLPDFINLVLSLPSLDKLLIVDAINDSIRQELKDLQLISTGSQSVLLKEP